MARWSTATSAINLANNTPGQADGNTIGRTVTVGPGDLPAGATITDVNIAVEFEKIDHENCANPYTGGMPYNREIVFYLTSPGGTRVVLVESQYNWGGSGLGPTYTSSGDYGGHVTVMFDDAAVTLVGGPVPVSGAFRPVRPLTALIGESPFGTWTLTIGDDAMGDALCFAGFNLAVTAEAEIEATVDLVLGVDPDYAGDTLVNQAQVSADGPDPDETNNIATVTTTVQTEADLSIVKSVLKDELCLGAYNVYEIEVANDGPSDAEDVYVTDVLTGALVYGGGSPECTYDGAVICSLERLPAGESHSFLVGVNLAPDVVDGTWITNTATVSSNTPDPNTQNDTSWEVGFTAVQCFLPEADLSILKTMAPDPATAGEPVHIVITVTNSGPNAAEGVIVQDLLAYAEQIDNLTLPDGWSCDGGVTCVRANPMPAGAVETLAFDLFVAPGRLPGSYDNLAYVVADSPDPDAADNLAAYSYQVNTEAALAIAKVGLPDPVIAGEVLLYQLTVTNTGPSLAYDVAVSDTLPAGTAFAGASPGCAAASGVVTCQMGDLGLNTPRSAWIAVRVDADLPAGTTLLNQACAVDTANTLDNTPVCATDETLVEQSALIATDLELTKTVLETSPVGEIYSGTLFADGYAVAGGYVEYQIVVANTGPITATDVVVFDQLPYRFTYAGADFDASFAPAGPFLCTAESCALGAIPPAGVVTTTLQVLVESNAPLSTFASHLFTNSALVQAANPDPNPTNNYDQADVTVEPLVDLSISKEATPDPVTPGEELTYQILVYNDGPSDLHWDWGQMQFGDYDELFVYDPLPDEIDPSTVVVELSGGAGYCGVTQGVVDCVLDLPATHAAIATVHGRVWPGVTAPFTNTVYAADYYQTDSVSATVQTEVAPLADLAMVKTATATANAGEPITYTLAVYNAGPSDAAGVSVVDTLPGGVALSWASPGCTPGPGGTVACAVDALPVGGQVTATLVVLVDSAVEPGTSLENVATVTATTAEANPADNTDTADTSITGLAELALDKQGPQTAVAGELITYTLVVYNAGPSAAQSAVVADALPEGVALVSASFVKGGGAPVACGGPTCHLGDVAAGQTATVTVVGMLDSGLDAGTLLTNQANIVSDTPEGDLENNADGATTVVATEADLAVDKVDLADPVEPLEGYLYQVNVYNYGASDARDVVVVDTLGEGVTFSAASPGCTGQPGGQVVTCTLDLLEAGEQTFFLLAVTAGDVPSGTLLLNDVAVSSATPDPAEANNTDQETTTVRQEFGPSADLAIVKTATPALVPAGELVTYVLTVTNAGPLAATGVQVLEMIPADTEMVSIVADNPDFWYEFCTLSGVCYLGTVYPNSTVATVTALLRIDPDCQATSVTNVASVSGDQLDYYPDNNFDSAVVEVIPLTWADLVLDKNATATAHAGELITYTLTVWNLGPQPAASMLVTDTLPPDVTLAWADAACAVPAVGTVVCGEPLLDAGQAVTFTLIVTVDAGVEPGTSLENAAVAGSLAGDPDPSNNADTADTSIVGWTDLDLDKTGPEWITKGGLVTYTIVVTNYGPSTAQSVDVKDDLPAEIDLVSATVQRSGQDPALCGGLVCQVGDMAVGEVITVTVVGQADPDLPANLVLTNTATVFSDTPEDDLSNNTDEHPVWVRWFSIYLPIIYKSYLPAPLLPDLVGSFTLTPDQSEYQPDEPVLITVVITNQGTVAAGPFWVDFYLNPDPVPTGPSLPWNEACSLVPCYGLTWEAPAGLAPGESVVLTSTPDSYDVTRSLWSGYFASGTSDLYLYVDSWNPGSAVGAVLESNEANNRAERHGLVVPGGLQPMSEGQAAPQFPPR